MWLLGAAARGLRKNCWKHCAAQQRGGGVLLEIIPHGWQPWVVLSPGEAPRCIFECKSTIQYNKGKLSFTGKDFSAELTVQKACRVDFFSGCTLLFQWLMKVGYLFSWACQAQGLMPASCLVSFLHPRRIILSTWLFLKEAYTALCWDPAIRKATPLPWSPKIE